TVKLLKGKWKSIPDAYTRHLRLLRDFRSGAAACAPGDYVHAKELEFLRPVLVLGRTESCWEDSTQNKVLDKDASSQQIGQELTESQMSTPAHSTSATPVGDEESTPPICPCVPARANVYATRRAPKLDFNRMLDIYGQYVGKDEHQQVSCAGFCKVSGRSDGECTIRTPSRHVGRYLPIHSHIYSANHYIYSGENKYLIHCQFCRFSYLQRMSRS
ncbi:hypothetical protein AB205_0123690, partial [Aquarana catesbeiana]